MHNCLCLSLLVVALCSPAGPAAAAVLGAAQLMAPAGGVGAAAAYGADQVDAFWHRQENRKFQREMASGLAAILR